MIYLNVTVIYGNSDSDTYDYTKFLLDNLSRHLSINLTEYFLSEEFFLPCNYSCINLNNKHCDNYNSCIVNKIAKSVSDSDLIIFDCPNVKKHLLTPQLKFLLNHLCHIWMPHKNNIPMYEKIGLIISDNYIPFFPSTYKILKKDLKFLGMKNILNFSFKSYEKDFQIKNKDSKNYLNLVFLSLKILNLISSSNNFSGLISKKVIKFPYSKLINNRSNQKNKDCVPKVIPMKNIQNNI